MARKPPNFTWLGFTDEQIGLLEFLDHLGNNGWARNGQTEELMPKLLDDFAEEGVSLPQIKQAMADIGYSRQALHELDIRRPPGSPPTSRREPVIGHDTPATQSQVTGPGRASPVPAVTI